MGRRGGDELQADALAHAGEHDLGADCEVVAAVELGGNLRLLLRRPVALTVEVEAVPVPAARAWAFRQRDGALDVRAPVRVDDAAVMLFEARTEPVIPARRM